MADTYFALTILRKFLEVPEDEVFKNFNPNKIFSFVQSCAVTDGFSPYRWCTITRPTLHSMLYALRIVALLPQEYRVRVDQPFFAYILRIRDWLVWVIWFGPIKSDQLIKSSRTGFRTVLTSKAGVDDPERFRRSRTVAAHFGLTPRRFQSGEIEFDGHTSRAGDADVRSTLYVAADSMLTRSSKWSPLKAWGMKLAKTRGHKKAVIAVARKLAVILHRMWIDDTRFRWSAEAARS